MGHVLDICPGPIGHMDLSPFRDWSLSGLSHSLSEVVV